MIERWEDPTRRLLELQHEAPYSIGKLHKHIPEIMRYGGLNTEPQFLPAVGPFSMRHAGTSHFTVQSLSQVRHRKSNVGNPGVAIRE